MGIFSRILVLTTNLLFFLHNAKYAQCALWITDFDENIMAELSSSPNVTDPISVCDKIRGLHSHQTRFCYRNPAIMLAVGDGNRRTLEHLEKVFEEDGLPTNLLVYKSLFSYHIADGSKREAVYLASLRTSAIAHELAVACSDGLGEDGCPCYRPPREDPELKMHLGLPLVLDQGCPYALAHAQRIALDFVLNDPELTSADRNMLMEHVVAAAKSVEAGWIDPEEEWERKIREIEENAANLDPSVMNRHTDL